jgi:hypothetical protein
MEQFGALTATCEALPIKPMFVGEASRRNLYLLI